MDPENLPQRPPAGQPAAPADADLSQLLTQVSLLRARGQLGEALTLCRQAVERAPESWEACELLGDLYRQDGKGEEAMAQYRAALARNPGRGVIEEKIARASLIAAKRRRVLEQTEALLEGRLQPAETRKPGMAALFSLVVPGLGQIYNHDFVKGAALLLVWVVLAMSLLVAVTSSAAGHIDRLLGAFVSGRGLVLSALLALVYLYAVADAGYRAGLTVVGSDDIV